MLTAMVDLAHKDRRGYKLDMDIVWSSTIQYLLRVAEWWERSRPGVFLNGNRESCVELVSR